MKIKQNDISKQSGSMPGTDCRLRTVDAIEITVIIIILEWLRVQSARVPAQALPRVNPKP